MVDGSSRFGAFFRIALPLAIPGTRRRLSLRVRLRLERISLRPDPDDRPGQDAARATGRQRDAARTALLGHRGPGAGGDVAAVVDCAPCRPLHRARLDVGRAEIGAPRTIIRAQRFNNLVPGIKPDRSRPKCRSGNESGSGQIRPEPLHWSVFRVNQPLPSQVHPLPGPERTSSQYGSSQTS